MIDRMKPRNALKASAAIFGLANAALLLLLLAPATEEYRDRTIPQRAALTTGGDTDVSALLSAPLFDPARRASAAEVAAVATEEAAPLRLTPKGTSISGDQRAVVLSGGGEPIVLREGESRYGVKIIEISAKSVVMETDSGRRTVALAGF